MRNFLVELAGAMARGTMLDLSMLDGCSFLAQPHGMLPLPWLSRSL